MLNKVRDFIDQEGLLSSDGLYIVALSGGADSVALLRILHDLGYRVEAAHCNFHLRGEESNRDELFVKSLCSKLQIPLHLIHFDTVEYASIHKVSIEMAARELRYRYFGQLCEDIGASAVCVAHHRDDAVETFFINLLRGSGIHGLTGIRPQQTSIIRPLLCVSREEIEKYLQSIGQDYVTDSTNLVDDVVRNKIRLNVLLLLREISPNVSQNIAKTTLFLREAEKVYNHAIDCQKKEIIQGFPDQFPQKVSMSLILQQPSPECLLHEWLAPYGFNSTHIEQIMSHLNGKSGKEFISSTHTLFVDRESFILMPTPLPMKTIKIPEAGCYRYDDNVLFSVEQSKDLTISKSNDLITVDADKVRFPIILRPVQTGDQFSPYGMEGHRLVSDYLTDLKMSLPDKRRQLVLTDRDNQIIWLVGLRTDNYFKITNQTTKILRVMKKVLLLIALLCIGTQAWAGHYKNFKTTAYVMVQDVNRIATVKNWEALWPEYERNLKLDKVYLETFRDNVYVDEKAMQQAIKFFKSKGVEVSGGITYNFSGSKRQRWESFCYSNPEHLKMIKDIAVLSAGYFDQIVLDDYYFTNCKCDLCIAAKGNRSWGDFRMDLLDKVGKEYIVEPAHRVNPKCKVIIKYPNWYDHFHGLGFDLKRGPYTFDGVYTGTETRNPESEQHLQAYESFGIIRYFENIRPQHNFGGWVDMGGAWYPDIFAEQLWLTLLAKAPEITLFNFSSMMFPFRDMPRIWDNDTPSLDIKELKQESAQRGISQPTWGRIADYAYEKIDPLLSKLGCPKGIKAYKPFNSSGDDFLHNYMGMVGIPVEIVPEFPDDEQLVILTECAKEDPDILTKMKSLMKRGGDVVVTSGFYRAMQDKGVKDIFEMVATDRKADIDTVIVSGGYGRGQNIGKTATSVKIPVFTYYTNDSWEDITTLSYGNGWPLLQHSVYSEGNIYVWVIPDNFSHLYALPENALNRLRAIISRTADVYLEGPSQVALMTYDNETFVVHSFHHEPVTISLVTRNQKGLVDLLSGEVYKGEKKLSQKINGRESFETNTVTITIPPHSFRGFKLNK